MFLVPAVVVIALGQASAAAGPLAPWKLTGRFVEEQAVEDARCAATLDDLCRALGVEQEGFLEARDGDVSYRGDGECWDVPFRAERVDGDIAEGWFERPDPDGAPPKRRCAGESCTGRRVQLHREGDTLTVLGPIETLGGCDVPERDKLRMSVVRFVPQSRLASEAAERAARLGLDLRGCRYKTERGSGPPRPCALDGGELPLRATGILPEYCPDAPLIRMLVENISDTSLTMSVTVQRRDDVGRWQEYSADVFGTNPSSKTAMAPRLANGDVLEIRWRPEVASFERRLREGAYRVVATTLASHGVPARRTVVAAFVVRRSATCAQSR